MAGALHELGVDDIEMFPAMQGAEDAGMESGLRVKMGEALLGDEDQLVKDFVAEGGEAWNGNGGDRSEAVDHAKVAAS